MDTRPFDPADYLDSEEAIAAYLADARAEGASALSRAVAVVGRARARMTKARIGVRSRSVPKEAGLAKNTGSDFRRGAVTARTQFQHADGSWQKRDERSGQVMERKPREGPLIQLAARPGAGAAQASSTAGKAVSTRTSKASLRTVRRRRVGIRKPSSGITPRCSGSTRNTRGSSRPSPMGKTPLA